MCQVVIVANAFISTSNSSTEQHCETVAVNSDSLLVLVEIGTAVVVIVLIAGLTMKSLGKKIVHSKYFVHIINALNDDFVNIQPLGFLRMQRQHLDLYGVRPFH